MRPRVALLGLVALGALLAPAAPAPAQTVINVTVLDDPVPDASCSSGGDCSLREAIAYANALGGTGSTVRLRAGAYSLTRGAPGDADVLSGDLDVFTVLTLEGEGAATTTIDLVVADRLLDIGGVPVTVRDLTISGGGQVDEGGAIRAGGAPLVLERVALRTNTALFGGAVFAYASADVTITDSVFAGNQALEQGGGLAAVPAGAGDPATVTITGGEFTDNVVGGRGGGVYVNALAALNVSGTSFQRNTAFLGGGLMVEGSGLTATIADAQILDNQAMGGGFGNGGGIMAFVATALVVERTLIEGNTATGSGGALRLINTDTTLTETHLSANEGGDSGAISVDTSASPTRLVRSLVDGNIGGPGGVGALHVIGGTLTLDTTTVSGNTGGSTGGIRFEGTMNAISSTIAGNASTGNERGNLTVEGDATLTGTLVADAGGAAQPDDLDCVLIAATGTLTGTGSVASDASCALPAGNLNSVDPMIAPLALNGGTLASHALRAGSPAIDVAGPTCPTPDARGQERPVDGDQDGTPACDAGAYEFVPSADLTLTLADSPDPVGVGDPLTYTATVFNAGPLPAVATVLVVTLDDRLEEIAAMPDLGSCVVTGQVVTCDLGDLAMGTEARVRVGAVPAADGPLTTTAQVSSSAVDPTPADAVVEATTSTGPGGPAEGVVRLAGPSRVETAVAVSEDAFADGTAGAAVLARADLFPDALAGTPLAIALGGPLLLTQPDALHPAVADELQRVLPAGADVVLLGGPGALSEAVAGAVEALGFTTRRLAGGDRFQTAVVIADEGLANPDTLLIADGGNFPDALAAGPGAAAADGAVLLTAGNQVPPALAAYLAGEGSFTTRYAVGGPAAQAIPEGTPLVGPSRVETALAVADVLFASPDVAGLATGANFPDALAGGAHVGALGGPILLTGGDALHPAVEEWLTDHAGALDTVYLYGGEPVLSAAVEDAVGEALAG